MYQHTKLPSYLPMPRFLMNIPISNTAKLLYTQFLGKAQLSQKNAWVDSQGRVYFFYPIHQIAVSSLMRIRTQIIFFGMEIVFKLSEKNLRNS